MAAYKSNHSDYLDWCSISRLTAIKMTCCNCNTLVSADHGMVQEDGKFRVAVCPSCQFPNAFQRSSPSYPWRQVFGPLFGENIDDLPDDIRSLYNEARECMSFRANTAASMLCRKLLMNIAASKGAKSGENYAFYVAFLADKYLNTAENKDWIDEIRQVGNEANHELPSISRDTAESIIQFTEMLLKLIFEYPAKKKKISKKRP